MRRAVTTVAVAALAAAAGWAGGWYSRTPPVAPVPTGPAPPPAAPDVNLALAAWAARLPATVRANHPDAVAEAVGTPAVTRIAFAGKTFWLVDRNRGFGVPYTTIGLYAPAQDGTHSLVLEAESCGAGWIKPELDAATGVLVLREHARSTLEGQAVLSCNLRSVGTYRSVHGE